MRIAGMSRNYEPQEIFKMSKSPSVEKLSTVEGLDISVTGYLEYEDEDSKGNLIHVLSLEVGENVYATNSATFIRGFHDILDIFGDNMSYPIKINVGTGTSKAGRQYLKCDLA